MRIWIRLALAAALSGAGSGVSSAQEVDLVLAAQLLTLDDPIVVETRRGQDFAGEVESHRDGTLVLVAEVGEGEVVYTFDTSDILRVRFPGNELKEVALEYAEGGEYTSALTIIDKLFEQRASLFSLVGETEVNYFAQTIPIYRAAERLGEAYERIGSLRPYLHEASVIRLLEAEQLLLAHQLGMKAEADELARLWIESEGRAVKNALGSCLLALSLIEEGRVEDAFHIVLFPVTFSQARSIPYLDNCYAIALELARFLEEEASAAALSQEFELRGLVDTLQWNDFSPPDYTRLDFPRPPL